jgi:hypothetical protein
MFSEGQWNQHHPVSNLCYRGSAIRTLAPRNLAAAQDEFLHDQRFRSIVTHVFGEVVQADSSPPEHPVAPSQKYLTIISSFL